MNRATVISELIDEFAWLYGKYSNELRSATQPYLLERVENEVNDYKYRPMNKLVRETLLEHVGVLPVIATTIYPYIADKDVDLGEALIMLAVHDIGELITGDVNTFTKSPGNDTKEHHEALKLLHASYHDLYMDIELQASKTAKFAKSVDKLAGDIMDYVTPAEITIQRLKYFVGVDAAGIVPMIMKHKRPYMLWNPFLTEFHKVLVERIDTKLKGVG
jgi:hypothetical protein